MDRRIAEDACKYFEEVAKKVLQSNEQSPGAVEMMKNAISGAFKADMLAKGDSGYSQRTYYSRDGDNSYRSNSYDGGNSYGHYTRGYYSRDDGYSGHGMREHLDKMMQEAKDERQRDTIRRFMSELEQ